MAEGTAKKTAAYLYVDPDRSALGLSSRAAFEMAGRTVLSRTLERLRRINRFDEIIIFCPRDQKQQVARAAGSRDVVIIELQEPVSISPYVRRRKWALSSWRGGMGEATVFDEQPISVEMVKVLGSREVQVAVPIAPEAVLIDSELTDAMIRHHHEYSEEMRFTFSNSAPGLTPCVFRLDLLYQAAMMKSGMGDVLAYDPDRPHMDFINDTCCFESPQPIVISPFRYLADTQRNMDRLSKALNNGLADGQVNANEAVAAMSAYLSDPGSLPQELEIEITTAPSLRIEGYPHRKDSGRGPMRIEQFEKIIRDCSAYDDLCLTIGGFGEPLAHPELPAMIAAAKEAGIYGINVETDGLRLVGALAEQLARSQADVISVWLDADSEPVYTKVKGQKGFEQVIANIEAFMQLSKEHNGPMVVPHLVKTDETLSEMEGFYDRWLRASGAAVMTGYNDFAGQIQDRAVMNMCPPKRYACGRLWKWLTILADGTATCCSQDFKGDHAVGNVFEQSVSDIWQGDALNRLRQTHTREQYEEHPLCRRCKEWHR